MFFPSDDPFSVIERKLRMGARRYEAPDAEQVPHEDTDRDFLRTPRSQMQDRVQMRQLYAAQPIGVCPDCGLEVTRAWDDRYDRLILLEEVKHRSGQMIVSGGAAKWWGPTGGGYRKHAPHCRRTT